MLDKIKGGIFGVAIGDALGATTEFMSEDEIREKYGIVTDIIGGGWLSLRKGETTDDTSMTISVAQGIIKNKEQPIEEIGNEFLKWYATSPPDIGITIRSVFSSFDHDWFEAAYRVHKMMGGKSAGNGSLMRCLPIAMAYREIGKLEEITYLHSKMTHYDDKAAEASLIYNRIAWRVLKGEALKSSIIQEIKHTRYEKLVDQMPSCPPDGYVVHTMSWVLYWLLHDALFEDVVVHATNKGGDSDTIAAIAGGLKGLEIGYSGIPGRFVEEILDANLLEEISQKLAHIYSV